jgi:uncharacterized repeat protein (TIGR01451 family)
MRVHSRQRQFDRLRWQFLLAPMLVLASCLAGVTDAVALTGFTLEAELPNPDPTDTYFGLLGLALSGDRIMVAGLSKVYVFERTGTTWNLVQTLTDPANTLNFGNVVALEGDVAVITGPPFSGQNQYFVYVREAGSFVRKTQLVAPSPILINTQPTLSNGKVMIRGRDALTGPTRYALLYEMPAGGWPTGTMTPTTVVTLGEDMIGGGGGPGGGGGGYFDDRFLGHPNSASGNDEVPTMAFLTDAIPHLIKVWEQSSSGWGEVATLTASDAAQGATVNLADLQGDTVVALGGTSSLDGRVYLYHPSDLLGGWTNLTDTTEDAVISIGTPTAGVAWAAVSDTTLVVRGISTSTVNNNNTLFIYDRAPGTRWMSTDTPAEQHVVPGSFNKFVIDGRTILAGHYVYAAPKDRPVLQLEKTTNIPLVNVNAPFDYQFTITNTGTAEATGVTLTDTLPAGVTLDGPLPASCTSSPAGAQIEVTCLLGTVGLGTSMQVVIHVLAPPDYGTIENMAAVTSDQSSTPVTDSASIGVSAAAVDLWAYKTGPSDVIAGEPFQYEITIGSNGPGNASQATMTDDLPSGIDFVSATSDDATCSYNPTLRRVTCDIDVSTINLPSTYPIDLRGEATIELTVVANQVGTFVNTATVSDPVEQELIPEDNTSQPVTTTATVPAFSIRDTLNNSQDRLLDYGEVVIGEQLTATIIITNTGGSPLDRVSIGTPTGPTAPFSVTAQDCFDTALIGGQLPPDSCQITVAFAPTQTGAVAQTIELPIFTSASGATLVPISLTGTGVTLHADIAITKTADKTAVSVGDTVTFTITVRNVTGAPATVRVTDKLPAPLSFQSYTADQGSYNPTNGFWSVGELQPGEAAKQLHLVTHVGALPPNSGGCIDNTATAQITSPSVTEIPGGNSNSATWELSVGVGGCADIAITDATQRFADGLVYWDFAIANFGPGLFEGPLHFKIKPPNGAWPPWLEYNKLLLGVGIVNNEIVSVPPFEVPDGAGNAANVMQANPEHSGDICAPADNGTAVICVATPPTPLNCRPGIQACAITAYATIIGNGFSGGISAEIHAATFDPHEENNRVTTVRPAPFPLFTPTLNLGVALQELIVDPTTKVWTVTAIVRNDGPADATSVSLAWQYSTDFFILNSSSPVPCLSPVPSSDTCVMDLGNLASGASVSATLSMTALAITGHPDTVPSGQDAYFRVFVTETEQDIDPSDDSDAYNINAEQHAQ